MKKIWFLILVLGLMVSCAGEQKKPGQTPEVSTEQIEAMENSIQDLDETIQKSDAEMEKSQIEIDSLLNNI